MTIHRKPIVDNIFRTTGIGHHVNREAGVTARFLVAGETVEVIATELIAGEKLVLGDLHTFKIGSLISYALESGQDPVRAIDRAREQGHDLVWINSLGAMLTAERRDPEPVVRVHMGMPILFQGVIYRLDPAANRNLKLTPYTPSLANAEVA
ncbi:MAG: hypothetical protein KJ944_08555 [Alphaproteobacteria bacterium]|nr:hypothetical protein [Alphaproteobacteria bacterium]MBU1561534.1 hypothetical protein [Alphaproteobacteria bacterium]MBU2302633.1 hypothetical protein [Alphaproteobacteria bacterium]MBU2367707.1 hypothetical protein [Alphaproteobacteria bacterium]